MNRLSHSSLSKYMDCPKSFELHYRKRLRSTTTTGALLFGSAIDKAAEALIKGDPEYKNVFAWLWSAQEINGVKQALVKNPLVVYSNADYDADLLEDYDKALLTEHNKDWEAELSKIYDRKEVIGYDGLKEEDKILLNFANWLSLLRKGHIMLESLKKDIVPKITEVLSTQEKISLKNDNGDEVIGYVDFVARWKDYPNPIVFDFKTSSREYSKDAVLVSPQLTLYVHALADKYKTREAGFIVINKNIKKNKTKVCSKCAKDGTGQRHKTCDNIIEGKRCNAEWIETINPEAMIQVLINEIPEKTEDLVIENIEEVNNAIEKNVFIRNLSSCQKAWGPCTYKNLCWGKSSEGLVEVEERK